MGRAMFHRGAGANAIRIEYDGFKFRSKAEAARYQKLKIEEAAGLISNLEVFPRFKFPINSKIANAPVLRDPVTNRAITYTADFRYQVDGQVVVEDVKGWSKGAPILTPVYRIKRALMYALLGIQVKET
jgi:hypothetical protein